MSVSPYINECISQLQTLPFILISSCGSRVVVTVNEQLLQSTGHTIGTRIIHRPLWQCAVASLSNRDFLSDSSLLWDSLNSSKATHPTYSPSEFPPEFWLTKGSDTYKNFIINQRGHNSVVTHAQAPCASCFFIISGPFPHSTEERKHYGRFYVTHIS